MHRFFLLPLFLGVVACSAEVTLHEEEAVETTEAAIDVAQPEESTTEAAIDGAATSDKKDKYGGECGGECAGCAEGHAHDHHGS
jgi:hypothetical protein